MFITLAHHLRDYSFFYGVWGWGGGGEERAGGS